MVFWARVTYLFLLTSSERNEFLAVLLPDQRIDIRSSDDSDGSDGSDGSDISM